MQKVGLELVFVLDRSASMAGLERDTVDSFNAMITQQKGLEGGCVVTTVLFDTFFQVLHDRVPLKDMVPLTVSEFVVQGHTALLDAVGSSIERIKAARGFACGAEAPGQTLFVIITDGMENASCRYDTESVRGLIQQQRKRENWRFLFLGAGIDAVSAAREIGIDRRNAVTFVNDDQGVALSYEAVSKAIQEYRQKGTVSSSWKYSIEGYK